MSTNTFDESPDINKKKQEQNGEDIDSQFTWENTKQFLTSVVYLIILVFVYFGLSGFVLYGCKVAQSNLMPTSANCAPYETVDPTFNFDKTECNIFETIFEDPTISEKINFSYSDENKKNSVLDWLRTKKIINNSSFLYLIYSIIESLFVFNFNCLNIFLNWMNRLPEWLVVLFGPIVFLFWACIVVGLSSIYYIILSIFMPFRIFLKEKATSNDLTKQLPDNFNWNDLPEKYKWRDVGGGYEWWIRLGFAFCLLLFTLVYFAISSPLSGLIMIWSLITIFSYVGYMKTPDNLSQKVGVSNIAYNIYGQYKRLIVFVLTILIILTAFSNLGTITGVISIITVISIYFGWVPIKVFEKFNYEDLTPLADDKQTEKTCSFSDTELQRKGLIPEYNIIGGSFLENLFNFKIAVPIVSSNKTDTETYSKTDAAANNGTANNDATNIQKQVDRNTLENDNIETDSANTDSKTNIVAPPSYDDDIKKGLGGGRKIKNKSLSKYKNKYNVLNYK
jgi:hypothetical protein